MSAHAFACPQCGAPVEFKSGIAVFAVCAFCRSMVVRKDLDVESLGTMAQLPPDLTPLQIGARGVWRDRPFEIVGRVRVAWEDGNWNEWFAIFGENQPGWIAESQGIFMPSFVETDDRVPSSAGYCEAGQALELAGRNWAVSDIKQVTTLAGEGALPFVAKPGTRRTGVDLMSSDGSFATIEYQDQKAPQLFVGAYAAFDDLQLTNLRPVPGWSSEVEVEGGASALTCPSCGAAITLRAAGKTIAAVCGSCGSIIDATDPNLRLIQAADERTQLIQPILPLGTRGKLDEVDYEIIGYVVRGDESSHWSEYLLFNPWKGFRWLVTYSGHWSLVDRVFRTPLSAGCLSPRKTLGGMDYDLFARESVTVQSVLGEFYWRVKRGEACQAADYIHPPYILTSEKYPDLREETWSHGVYLESVKVAQAFNVKLPAPSGPYLNEPNTRLESWRSVRKIYALFLVLVIAIQFGSCVLIPSRTLYDGQFTFNRQNPSNVFVSPRFKLPAASQAVTVNCRAPVDGNWLGMDVALVNAATEQSYAAELSVEYYHGVEDGESWSEGGQSASVKLPSIPAGEYYLSCDVDADPAVQQMNFLVHVQSGELFPENFFFVLILLSIYPIWLWFRQRSFEQARWAQSDFTPTGARHVEASDDDS